MLKSGRELEEGLWVFDRPLSVLGIEIGARMTAVRLTDGGLWLHSPVKLDAETRSDLETLGPVRFVVAPNKVHHLFVAPYAEAFPDAELWAAPGLPEKKKQLRFDHVLGDDPPDAWAGEIDQLLFAGVPTMNECVFLHRRTRTLIVADLAMNFTGGESLMTRLSLRLMGLHQGFGTSRMVKRLVRDREAARTSLEQLLAWDFDRVIVTHGIVLQRSGRRLMRETWSWLRHAGE
ncbi:MAG: DUF4336 domain-containing protein [Myxococcota bacterium]|nr:DUF4336 domain-containing protein [Myxococcota bacterium]